MHVIRLYSKFFVLKNFVFFFFFFQFFFFVFSFCKSVRYGLTILDRFCPNSIPSRSLAAVGIGGILPRAQHGDIP